MNYYQYKRRAPRRRKSTDYFKPFLLIVLLIAIFWSAWRLTLLLLNKNTDTSISQEVSLQIESGSAKAMTSGGPEWRSIPSNINLYAGERVRTQSDGRLTLDFFDGSQARLDRSSQLGFEVLSEDAASSQVEVMLYEGNLWVDTQGSPGFSEFTVKTDQFKAKAANSALFSVTSPETLYVLSGEVMVDVLDNEEVVKTLSVGVGQQLVLSSTVLGDIEEGFDQSLVFALEDSFKTSNWYRWNVKENGELSELTDEEGDLLEETDVSEAETSDALDDDVEEAEEQEITEAPEEEVVDVNDKTPPAVPQFSDPGLNDDVITLEETTQVLTGTVSKDTHAVIVNDYRLSRYVPGETSFTYTANVDFANLEAGENKYEAYALDKAGNKSAVGIITLILPEDLVDTDEEEVSTGSEDGAGSSDSEASAEPTGGVSFDSPNGGVDLATSETSFILEGTVPGSTAKVLVNDYQLQAYEAGSTSFKYNAKASLGTLEIGEVNVYKVEAYDDDGKLIGSDSMSIDVENVQGAEVAPVISLPSDTGAYSTTLNEVVVGGSIGKWVDKVSVDGVILNDYIPGSEEWSTTVELDSGENTITVFGIVDGENTASASINITLE